MYYMLSTEGGKSEVMYFSTVQMLFFLFACLFFCLFCFFNTFKFWYSGVNLFKAYKHDKDVRQDVTYTHRNLLKI